MSPLTPQEPEQWKCPFCGYGEYINGEPFRAGKRMAEHEAQCNRNPLVSAGASAPAPLRIGARVWLNEDVEQHNRIVVGTIHSISPAGYVRVKWDEPNVYPESYFSPLTAADQLRVVTGDDAIPRHDWDCQKDQTDPPCLRCGVIQTDANELGPCQQAAAPASAPPEELLPPDIEWNLALAGDAKAPFVQAPASAPPEGVAALRRVPEEYSLGSDRCNAQKAWLDGFDTAELALSSQLAAFQTDLEKYQARCEQRNKEIAFLKEQLAASQKERDAAHAHACEASLEERDLRAQLAAFQRREAALREALIAAEQFLPPEIHRGPDSNGWQNTVDMVRTALASFDPEKEPTP